MQDAWQSQQGLCSMCATSKCHELYVFRPPLLAKCHGAEQPANYQP